MSQLFQKYEVVIINYKYIIYNWYRYICLYMYTYLFIINELYHMHSLYLQNLEICYGFLNTLKYL